MFLRPFRNSSYEARARYAHAFDLSAPVCRLDRNFSIRRVFWYPGTDKLQYQKPPQAIVDLVDTRPTPNVEVSRRDSTGTQRLLIESFSGLPSVAGLAQPEIRLAGLRFNRKT